MMIIESRGRQELPEGVAVAKTGASQVVDVIGAGDGDRTRDIRLGNQTRPQNRPEIGRLAQ